MTEYQKYATVEHLPARHPFLELTDLEGEMLVYNPVTNQAFTLDSLSCRILLACDGQTERSALLAVLQQSIPDGTEDVLQHTLEQLAQNGLLKAQPSPGLTRRELIQRWGLAAAALPLIASVNLPTPAAAASGGGSCGQCGSCAVSCSSCSCTSCL